MKLYDGIVKGGHPVVDWYKKNHPFILCTDNPGILDTSLTAHYDLLKKELNLTDAEIWEISRRSVNFIFESDQIKQKLFNYFDSHPLKPKQ